MSVREMSPCQKPGAGTEGFTPIGPRACIGHVHLKVVELERTLKCHCGVLGFELRMLDYPWGGLFAPVRKRKAAIF